MCLVGKRQRQRKGKKGRESHWLWVYCDVFAILILISRTCKQPEERAVKCIKLEQEYASRAAKKARKQKKMYVVPPGEDTPVPRLKSGESHMIISWYGLAGCCYHHRNNPVCFSVSAGKAKPRPVIKVFDKELTDTSRKALKEYRKWGTNVCN